LLKGITDFVVSLQGAAIKGALRLPFKAREKKKKKGWETLRKRKAAIRSHLEGLQEKKAP